MSKYALNVVTHPKTCAIRWMRLTIAYACKLTEGLQFSGENVPHERSEVVMHPLTVIPEDSDLSMVCHKTFIGEGRKELVGVRSVRPSFSLCIVQGPGSKDAVSF
jgi:hypothetical protein